jgi:hypothetical protein
MRDRATPDAAAPCTGSSSGHCGQHGARPRGVPDPSTHSTVERDRVTRDPRQQRLRFLLSGQGRDKESRVKKSILLLESDL